MKTHRVSSATPPCHSIPAKLAAIALAMLFTASQVPAQPLDRDTTNQTQAAGTQATTTNQANDAVPAAVDTAADISAPVPNLDEATPVKPTSDSMFAMAAMQDPPASSSLTQTQKPVKKKAPLHGLGIALAITGTTFFVASAALFGLQHHFCSGVNNTNCTTIRTDTILGMSLSAPVAGLGFYFQFHK